MPVGATIKYKPVFNNPVKSVPFSLTSQWETLVEAGGVNVADAAAITNPATQIVRSTTRPFSRDGEGTTLLLKLRYDAGLSGTITSPIVQVFGKTLTDDYDVIETREGVSLVTLNIAPTTDVLNAAGTFKYTRPKFVRISFDCLGCLDFLVGVTVALAGTGTVNNATILGKIV